MELEDWIHGYSQFEPFMKECIEYINIYKIYVNDENECVSIQKESYPLCVKEIHTGTSQSVNKYISFLPKEHLIHIIDTNKQHNSVQYRFNSLLKLNFTIDHEETVEFIQNATPKNTNNTENTTNPNPLMNYFTFENCIEDVIFDDTIHYLKEFNDIYILYQQKPFIKYTSKKHNDKHNSNDNHNPNTTKKIRIHTTHHTRKKL